VGNPRLRRSSRGTKRLRHLRGEGRPSAESVANPIDDLYEFLEDDWPHLYRRRRREIEWREAEHGGATAKDRYMRLALNLVNDTIMAFRALGFEWCDYHSDNWGMLDGRPVLIDFGLLDLSRHQAQLAGIPVLPL